MTSGMDGKSLFLAALRAISGSGEVFATMRQQEKMMDVDSSTQSDTMQNLSTGSTQSEAQSDLNTCSDRSCSPCSSIPYPKPYDEPAEAFSGWELYSGWFSSGCTTPERQCERCEVEEEIELERRKICPLEMNESSSNAIGEEQLRLVLEGEGTIFDLFTEEDTHTSEEEVIWQFLQYINADLSSFNTNEEEAVWQFLQSMDILDAEASDIPAVDESTQKICDFLDFWMKIDLVECNALCGEMLRATSKGALRCSEGHLLCFECSTRSIDLWVHDPYKCQETMKCPICCTALESEHVEKMMTKEQSRAIEALRCSQTEEEIIFCPSCNGQIASTSAHGSWTQCGQCQHEFCQFCKESSVALVTRDGDPHPHVIECERSHQHLRQFLAIVSDCCTQKCPGCGCRGVKDESCTHMSCEQCQTSWCYCCGEAESDCDQDEEHPIEEFFRHNIGWPRLKGRCPMYLHEIGRVDADWPEEAPERCVELFHERKTLAALKKMRSDIGASNFDAVYNRHPRCYNSGFSLADIIDAKEDLWIRKECNQHCDTCGNFFSEAEDEICSVCHRCCQDCCDCMVCNGCDERFRQLEDDRCDDCAAQEQNQAQVGAE